MVFTFMEIYGSTTVPDVPTYDDIEQLYGYVSENQMFTIPYSGQHSLDEIVFRMVKKNRTLQIREICVSAIDGSWLKAILPDNPHGGEAVPMWHSGSFSCINGTNVPTVQTKHLFATMLMLINRDAAAYDATSIVIFPFTYRIKWVDVIGLMIAT
jgi:hypothetical protein